MDEKENVQLQAGKCKRKPMIFCANLIIQRVAVLRAELKRSVLEKVTQQKQETEKNGPFKIPSSVKDNREQLTGQQLFGYSRLLL